MDEITDNAAFPVFPGKAAYLPIQMRTFADPVMVCPQMPEGAAVCDCPWYLALEILAMTTHRIRQSMRMILVSLGFSAVFSLLGFGACFLIRAMCIDLGLRSDLLASTGGIMVLVSVMVLGGATLGAIVGRKVCLPEHRVSIVGSVAAFLAGGFGGLGALYAPEVLGVGEGKQEIPLLFMTFFIGIPFFTVVPYNIVAKIRGRWNRPLEKKPQK